MGYDHEPSFQISKVLEYVRRGWYADLPDARLLIFKLLRDITESDLTKLDFHYNHFNADERMAQVRTEFVTFVDELEPPFPRALVRPNPFLRRRY